MDKHGFPVLMSNCTSRRGRTCTVSGLTRCKYSVQRIKDCSFFVHGAKLFNGLPQEIRDIANCKFDIFKSAVDHWMQNIPDEPHLHGYHHRSNGSISNSLDVIST